MLMLGGALAACTSPSVPVLAPPAAASVDGHDISLATYQARLKVSRARDPFAGIPEAIPSPAPSQRLEDFTIEQLVREEIVRQEAAQRGISISDQAVGTRIKQLEDRATTATFRAALARNGFTQESFRDFERVLLTEVALVDAIARQRARSAVKDLETGKTFNQVVDAWNDDSATTPRHGEVGWVRSVDLPEPELRSAVESLRPGAVSGLIRTNRGYVIANLIERRADQAHLAVVLVLAPVVDLFSQQGTPPWFTRLIDERESALRRDGKIKITVGRAG